MYYGTDTRADALLIGCLVALLLSWGLLPQTDLFRRAMKTLAVLGTVFIAYLVLTITQENPNLYRGFATLVPLGVGAILIMLMLWPPAYVLVLLRLSPLRWVGRISYGLYLWHYPIRVFVCPDDHPCSGRHVLIPAAVAFAVTCLSFYLVEKPFLRMKKHFANA
jgi:peptidoglycan/LPS O-acetylase OafA/YrhL